MNRPKSVVCYICGREYGTHSIEIHIPQCKLKWENEQNLKPKKDRRPLPQPPQEIPINAKGMSGKELEEYNIAQQQAYNDKSLVPCVNCGRTFTEKALAHHSKGCSESNPFKAGNEKGGNMELAPCGKCGRKFAPDRVGKHEQVCKGTGGNGVMSGGGGSSTTSPTKMQQQQSPEKKKQASSSNIPPMKPIALMCYICGREYGTKSLGIHLKTCKDKYQIEQSKKPKSERKTMPSEPNGLMELLAKDKITHQDIEAYNSKSYDKYNNEALDMCPNCGRTFTPEALAHHAKGCSSDKPFEQGNVKPCGKCGRKFAGDRVIKHESVCKGSGGTGVMNSSPQKPPSKGNLGGGGGGGSSAGKGMGSGEKQIVRPKTLVCYICGREYGTTSLKIHIPQCEKKWRDEQEKLPKSQRRPVPEPPKQLGNLENATADEVQKYNAESLDQYNTKSLLSCPNCSRTFTAEAMKHHQKACTAEKPMKSVQQSIKPNDDEKIGGGGQQSQEMGEEVVTMQLAECSKCGRKFASNRLDKHEGICKGAK